MNWDKYAAKVQHSTSCGSFLTLQGLEHHVVGAAEECPLAKTPKDSVWSDPELRDLREKRRVETDRQERSKLSKLIWKLSRKKLREYRTKRILENLEKFADFQNMEHIQKYPMKHTSSARPDEFKCAELLQQVYSTNNPVCWKYR